jgi:hypothetical protein
MIGLVQEQSGQAGEKQVGREEHEVHRALKDRTVNGTAASDLLVTGCRWLGTGPPLVRWLRSPALRQTRMEPDGAAIFSLRADARVDEDAAVLPGEHVGGWTRPGSKASTEPAVDRRQACFGHRRSMQPAPARPAKARAHDAGSGTIEMDPVDGLKVAY